MYYPKKTFVKQSENHFAIGTSGIVKNYKIKNGILSLSSMLNRKLSPILHLIPQPASEEFIITLNTDLHTQIKTSDLTINKTELDETKNQITFYFKPYSINNTFLNIIMTVYADSFVIRKKLSFSYDGNDAVIDYFDFEHIVLGNDVKQQWSRPDMESAYLTPYHTALGQPVYLNGMFTGCEFPVTDNNIEHQTVFVRYYCGKKLSQLCADKRKFTSWPSVFGAASSLDPEIIRGDFLEYIHDISIPVFLRTQYNSWYDHMLDINDTNINQSFLEIEKGLSQNGVAPLDSYVVDDGWVDYDNNFWSINDKFPNELSLISDLAKKLSSQFGLWLGPRGGYNKKTQAFAQRIEESENGSYNAQSQDICIADTNYLNNITKFLTDFTNKFDINYWKLDGFMRYSCENPNHGHPIGGYNDMYCFTDCWESWIKVFQKIRKCRNLKNKKIWLNVTSYCNASPWFLQFCESFWIQNCSDIGFIDETIAGGKLNGNDYDRMLTYRDSKYFDFCRIRNYQFPLCNVFNHEPIYGNSAHITMSDDDYRNYMYMISTRGTAFWELYYSYNLFSDAKWKINADVLRFVKENLHILRNARLIGNSPDTGAVYGYSAWDDAEGIVSLRNPANHVQDFSVLLDRKIGISQYASNLSCITILPYTKTPQKKFYSFQDSFTTTLQPHEIKILYFAHPSESLPKLQNAKFISEHTVEFRFDRHIVLSDNSFLNGDGVLVCQLQENYSSVRVTVPQQLSSCDTVKIYYHINDLFGRSVSGNQTITYYEKDLVPISEGISGTGDFTVMFNAKNLPKNGVILHQGKEFSLTLNKFKPVLRVKGIVAQSAECLKQNLETAFSLVREQNGMIKLYIDGTLNASGYIEEKNNLNITKSAVEYLTSVKNVQLLNRALGFDEIKSCQCEKN